MAISDAQIRKFQPALADVIRARARRGPTLHAVIFAALLLISVVPVLLLGLWVQHSAFQKEIDAVSEKHLLIASNLSGALSRYVTDVREGFRIAVANLAEGAEPAATQRLLRSLSFRHVSIADGRNEIVSSLSGGPPGMISALPSGETIDGFREMASAAGGEVVITDIMRDGDAPAFFVLLALEDERLAVGALGTDFIRQVQRAITFGKRGHSMIVDRTGRVVAHPNPQWEASSKDASKISVVAKMMSGETGVSTFFSPPMQADMIAGHTVVPEVGWGVMVPQPVSELAERARDAQSVAIGMSLFGILVAGVIAWWLAKFLARPIVAVAGAAGEVAAGRLDTQVSSHALGTPRELRCLSASFNAMVAELGHRDRGLRRARSEAEAANRAKTEFLNNMSHELRTPLNAVIGFAETMVKEIYGPVGSPRYRGYANNIVESGYHLLAIINDILDLAKIESGSVELNEEDVDIAAAVDTCVALMGGRAEEDGLALTSGVPDDFPCLRAYGRAVRQILLNLLSNAIKFTPSGGRISVEARFNAQGGADLLVADTGIGIAEADIPTAVADFGQVDAGMARRYEGTGLGLPLVNRLATLHGARVRIDSAVRRGTTVVVSFPPERVGAVSASPSHA